MKLNPATTAPGHDVLDLALAEEGVRRIEWAAREMPVLGSIRRRFEVERPLVGLRIAACLHVTTETANLMRALVAGGADVTLCASNPLSTQDDAAAALVASYGIPTFAVRGADRDTYYRHLSAALDTGPSVTMDDGCDLVTLIHQDRTELLAQVLGGTEETTTGVIRLRAMAADGALKYPIIAVNEAQTKHLFDNRYGTGQSTLDGIIRATNVLVAGKTFVVGGYGWCARGIASRAQGHGANVIITEVDPLRALEAVMDGYRVMTMREAAPIGDLFVTATGDINVIDADDWARMKDGAIVANSGHFNVELNLPALMELTAEVRQVRDNVQQHQLTDGRTVSVLAEGRLVNLAAAEGHPASVMDMSFANQALALEYLATRTDDLEAEVYEVPADIDARVARLKLDAMGIEIDSLTARQEKYLASWREGT
ncbi:MAG: adenosylhomocysteinase [Anaerolineae bacterium]